MNCKKIIEIYNESCHQDYSVSGILVTAQVKIGVKNLQLQADKICLQSMKMLEEYCKLDITINMSNK